ncbi:hypothetical protein RJT17_35795 [Streptomyces sp. P5-A9]|uniref:hypothetical protein n=1 Tax=Streptomyces sp. P5-A9 TaxID=3071730 RepID=UPI002FC641D1
MAEKVKLTGASNDAGTAAEAKALSILGDMIAGGTASRIWTCCGTVSCPACSAECVRPPRCGSFPRAFTWATYAN